MLDIHWKDWCWSWNSNNLATWCEELTHWKRPWCWETLKVGGERDDRGWDGWIASLTQWTWVWTSFRIDREAWCATVHGVTKSWTQLSNWTELNWFCLMTWGRDSISGLILVSYPNWHHQPVMSRWDHSHLASSFIYLFLNTLLWLQCPISCTFLDGSQGHIHVPFTQKTYCEAYKDSVR